MTLRYWSRGRCPALTLGVLTIAIVLLYFWLHVPFTGPWSPVNDPRTVQMYELIPMAAGAIALYGIQPRLAWIDVQSPRPLRSANTLAAGCIAAVAAASAPVVRILWEYIPLYKVALPEESVLREATDLNDFFPTLHILAFSVNTIFILGLTLVSIALLGLRWGPMSWIFWFVLLLTLQGYGHVDFMASVHDYSEPQAPSLLNCSAAVLSLSLGLLAYHCSLGGAQPLRPTASRSGRGTHRETRETGPAASQDEYRPRDVR